MDVMRLDARGSARRSVRSVMFRVLLALVLVCGLVALPVARPDMPGGSRAYGETGGPSPDTTGALAVASSVEKAPADLTIDTAAEFIDFAAAVNAGDDFSGRVVRLAEDISLTGVEWTPIGSFAAQQAFAGTFDGDGHAIEGLTISEGDSVALFGYLTGQITDLTVAGTVSGGECVAGVVARLAGTVSGVTNRVTVAATGSYVGGIAADAAGTFLIADCANEGSVTNYSSDRSSGKLGGIIGRADTGTGGVIKRCQNSASITGYQYLGGIAGGVFGEVAIRTSFNTGTIEGKSFGKVYLGGIVGKLQAGTIDSCYNRGTVYGNRMDKTMGHIRAIGGIVGCEEHHTVGTAISQVYQAGPITLNTTGMDPAMDNHYIMMTGHISGGNSASGENTMTYEDCFYEEDCYPQTDPEHADFVFFRHDEGIALWDTPYVTAATTDDLKGAQVRASLGSAFEADTQGINDGYPVLAWQNGGTDVPAPRYTVREPVVLGGTAEVVAEPEQAAEGETVSITADSIESGKRVYQVAVTDAAGVSVAVSAQDDGSYSFAMPGRSVRVEVILENDAVPGAAYALADPEGLDAIWTVWTESSGAIAGVGDASVGSYAAGSTVFVHVQKNPDALSTTLLGISVNAAGADGAGIPVAELKEGLFAFTMPASDAAFSLEVSHALLVVATQNGEYGTPQSRGTYSRTEMEALAQTGIYYSGWASETDPMIGRADVAVPLSALLADAGVTFEAGDILRIGSIDGMSLSYPYEDLMATPRYYYPGIFDGSVSGRVAFEPILTIRQNVVLRSEQAGTEPPAGDTLNTYRFIFGQSEEDFANHTKVVDRLLKYVTSVTVVKDSARTGDIDGDGALTSADLTSMMRGQAGLATLTEAQRLAADMDGDGIFTMGDVVLLLKRLVGLP